MYTTIGKRLNFTQKHKTKGRRDTTEETAFQFKHLLTLKVHLSHLLAIEGHTFFRLDPLFYDCLRYKVCLWLVEFFILSLATAL